MKKHRHKIPTHFCIHTKTKRQLESATACVSVCGGWVGVGGTTCCMLDP